jgi:hypothetical protein
MNPSLRPSSNEIPRAKPVSPAGPVSLVNPVRQANLASLEAPANPVNPVNLVNPVNPVSPANREVLAAPGAQEVMEALAAMGAQAATGATALEHQIAGDFSSTIATALEGMIIVTHAVARTVLTSLTGGLLALSALPRQRCHQWQWRLLGSRRAPRILRDQLPHRQLALRQQFS